MSKQSIWTYLKAHTSLPDEAIAGIMGNFEAESNNEACRLQGDFTSDRRTSKTYAQNVNNYMTSDYSFAHDAKGWGLAQWTYWSRKENLLKTCRSYGVGIDDEDAQLAFFLAEMQMEYTSVWNSLLNCHSVYDAAGLVCTGYEKPAVNNIAARADYGNTIYKQFHGKDLEPEPAPTPQPVPVDDDKTAKIISLLEQIILLLKE
jgi:hypothetical protein